MDAEDSGAGSGVVAAPASLDGAALVVVASGAGGVSDAGVGEASAGGVDVCSGGG